AAHECIETLELFGVGRRAGNQECPATHEERLLTSFVARFPHVRRLRFAPVRIRNVEIEFRSYASFETIPQIGRKPILSANLIGSLVQEDARGVSADGR